MKSKLYLLVYTYRLFIAFSEKIVIGMVVVSF